MKDMEKIFRDTDFVHTSGTGEELRVAEYLKEKCEELGVNAHLEAFEVPMGKITKAVVTADGREIPCKGFFCCGSGRTEGELYYLPSQDPMSIEGAKDKIVLIDAIGIGYFPYQDLMKAGAKGILFQYGNPYYDQRDIDERDLRKSVVGDSEKVLCAMIHAADGMELVRRGVKTVSIEIEQEEYTGESHNVIADIPGLRDEYVVLSAHYDTTSMSHGSYDNMTGCVGLLGVMEKFAGKKPNYGLRFVFCGSEERGLLGSKAYVKAHEEELPKFALNINLDMIGTIMGKFISRVSAEEKLAHYISYMGFELGFPVDAKTGVYSSDSTPFADNGVPALSFARTVATAVAPIHCRYDTIDVLSMERMQQDIDFIAEFTRRMAEAKKLPVAREIPENIKKDLDIYLYRKKA